MTIACAGPDPDVGVAIRMAGYLDCQARALGENGFQALTGGPIVTGMLSGLVTILVALIGYRLVLGDRLNLRDGVTAIVRLGVVLALVTGWPAFQTLVYNVATDGPEQLAAALLPAAGLPAGNIEARVQQAYDTIRIGTSKGESSPPTSASAPGQPLQSARSPLMQLPLPQTASALVISTIGVGAALRLATGFLLAIAPLAIMCLLFEATSGVFSGWVRALAGTALALVAATVITAIDIVMVNSELARLQDSAASGAVIADPQAITTIILVFVLVMLVVVFAAFRVASAFRLPTKSSAFMAPQDTDMLARRAQSGEIRQVVPPTGSRNALGSQLTRASVVADALGTMVHREQLRDIAGQGIAPPNRSAVLGSAPQSGSPAFVAALGATGRRQSGRRSHSAARRDRSA